MSQTIQNPTYKYINKSTLPVYALILKLNGMKQIQSKSVNVESGTLDLDERAYI